MKKLTASKPLFALSLCVLAMLACKLGSSSPTATFKAFFEAQKKSDVTAIKKTLSKASLALLEKAAKAQNKTLDAAITEAFAGGSKTEQLPESRNEKIDGDNATLEIQDTDTKKWETMYFVKEDGNWKVALDRTMEELLKKMVK
jgi:hypothetical protein